MKSESRQPELPKLPHGDGVLVYTSNGKILYRKSIPVDGDYRRLAVTGYTLKRLLFCCSTRFTFFTAVIANL